MRRFKCSAGAVSLPVGRQARHVSQPKLQCSVTFSSQVWHSEPSPCLCLKAVIPNRAVCGRLEGLAVALGLNVRRGIRPRILLCCVLDIVIPSEVPRAFAFPSFSGARGTVRVICCAVFRC